MVLTHTYVLSLSQTILFSEDADILELISRHDEAYIVQTEDWFSSSMEDEFIPERPKTADEGEVRHTLQKLLFSLVDRRLRNYSKTEIWMLNTLEYHLQSINPLISVIFACCVYLVGRFCCG